MRHAVSWQSKADENTIDAVIFKTYNLIMDYEKTKEKY